MSHQVPICGLCENEIAEDDTVNEDGDHVWCRRLEAAQDRYRFYIMNPVDRPEVGFGLWVTDGQHEYPMLENTGGLTVYLSRSDDVGQFIPVKREFIEAFGYGWHWLMCYQPISEDQIAETLAEICEDYYSGVIGSHERWALTHLLIHALFTDEPLPPEWKELIEFADACTEFGVPDIMEVADNGREGQP